MSGKDPEAYNEARVYGLFGCQAVGQGLYESQDLKSCATTISG